MQIKESLIWITVALLNGMPDTTIAAPAAERPDRENFK
jgi:hypothetical protein